MTFTTKAGKPVTDSSDAKGEDVSGKVIAITNSEGPTILVEDEDKVTWVSLHKRDMRLLLATLGPDPLDGKRNVLIRTDEFGKGQNITVYTSEII